MSNPNYLKVRNILKTTLAGQKTEEDAIDDLTRMICRAYYNGLNAPQHGNGKTRPRKKTRLNTG